ncbi:MAG: hypothetical protein Q9170_007614 [Blastenia crenularia]
MSGLEIAASIVTFISASEKVAEVVSRISSLSHAPGVLLALNNEVSDLRSVVEDLSELQQQHKDKLQDRTTPSFCRAIEKSRQVFLNLEKLVAYDLTVVDDQTGQVRLGRSRWLRAQKRIEQAQLDVRYCRIELATAISLMTSYGVREYVIKMEPLLMIL